MIWWKQMYYALMLGYEVEVRKCRTFTAYQYNFNWLIGVEGDIWVKLMSDGSLDILGDPSRLGLELDTNNRRGDYIRISNLPPIKLIVDIVENSSLIVTTRDDTLIMFTPEYPNGKTILNVNSAYRLQDGDNYMIVYMTTNRESIRAFNYRSSITESHFDNSSIVMTDPDRRFNDLNPMKLSNTLDSVAIRHHNNGLSVLKLMNGRLVEVYSQYNLNGLMSIHLNSLSYRDSIVKITMDEFDTPIIRTIKINIDGRGVRDAKYMDSIPVVRRSNDIMSVTGQVLISNVDRLVDVLHDNDVVIGTDGNTYHIILGEKVENLNIPIVIS